MVIFIYTIENILNFLPLAHNGKRNLYHIYIACVFLFSSLGFYTMHNAHEKKMKLLILIPTLYHISVARGQGQFLPVLGWGKGIPVNEAQKGLLARQQRVTEGALKVTLKGANKM